MLFQACTHARTWERQGDIKADYGPIGLKKDPHQLSVSISAQQPHSEEKREEAAADTGWNKEEGAKER